MEYGISQLAIIPLRAEASERSEMVSQLLFGETYNIIEWQEKWVRIITAYDEYEGWISRNQVTELGYESYLELQETQLKLTTKPVTMVIKQSDNTPLYLPAGSTLPFYEDNICCVADNWFEVGAINKPEHELLDTARGYLNTPYLWGGRTHFGIDCSGFVQTVFKQHGLKLKRDASQQAEQGRTLGFIQEAQAGDLAFFDNDEGRITHVGIMIDSETIIHASGRVRIDRIDTQGIYAEDQQRYTHKQRIIKRYLENSN